MGTTANEFLDGLLFGPTSEVQVADPIMERGARAIGSIADEAEERILLETNIWVVQHGLPEGEFRFELSDEHTGDALAVLDLAWPDGLQEGFSQPVAVLINEDTETESIVNQAGYLFFTDVDNFKAYVRDRILAIHEAAD